MHIHKNAMDRTMNDRIEGTYITSTETIIYDPSAHSLMEVMDGTGDTKNIWDPAKPDEVEVARATYDALKKKGYRGFRVTGKNGEKGEQMDEFDPAAGRMIMIPPLQGG